MKFAMITSAILAFICLGHALPFKRSLEERTFQPGWCGAHILKTVHVCDHSDPNCNELYGFQWGVNITVFDDRQKLVGNKYTYPIVGRDVHTITVHSALEKDLVYSVISGVHPDTIAYGADTENVASPQCAIGGDGTTYVSTDCGFKCEVS